MIKNKEERKPNGTKTNVLENSKLNALNSDFT